MIRKQRHVELEVWQLIVYKFLYAALLLFCQEKREFLPEASTVTERWQRVAIGTSEEGKELTSYGDWSPVKIPSVEPLSFSPTSSEITLPLSRHLLQLSK